MSINKNIIFTILIFTFIGLFTFSFLKIAKAAVSVVTVNVLNISTNTADFIISGLSPITSYNLVVATSSNLNGNLSAITISADNVGVSSGQLTGLKPGSRYYVSIQSADQATMIALDATRFLTPAIVNSTLPTISPSLVTANSAKISASGTLNLQSYNFDIYTANGYAAGVTLLPTVIIDLQNSNPVETTYTGLLADQDYIVKLSPTLPPYFSSPVITSFRTLAMALANNIDISIQSGSVTSTSATINVAGTQAGVSYNIYLWTVANYTSQTNIPTAVKTYSSSPMTAAFTGLTPGQQYVATLSEVDSYAFDPTSLATPPFTTLVVINESGSNGTITSPAMATTAFGGLVPLCNVGPVITIAKTATEPAKYQYAQPCDFNYFLMLINKVIDFLLITMATPLFVLIIIYAGWLYLSSAGSSENTTKAKKILKNSIIGYVIALAAWLVVKTILSTLGYHGPMYLGDLLLLINYA